MRVRGRRLIVRFGDAIKSYAFDPGCHRFSRLRGIVEAFGQYAELAERLHGEEAQSNLMNMFNFA